MRFSLRTLLLGLGFSGALLALVAARIQESHLLAEGSFKVVSEEGLIPSPAC